MRAADVHPVHTCHCGAHWVCSNALADRITPSGRAAGLAYCDPKGDLWRAPLGSPPPGNPMPSVWIKVKKP